MSQHRWVVASLLSVSVWVFCAGAQETNKAAANAAGPKGYPVLAPAADSGLAYQLLPALKPKNMDIRVKDGGITPAMLDHSGASAGDVLTYDGSSVMWGAPAGGSGWRLTGNTGTTPGTNFLGTTDDQPLEIRVNNARVMRHEPNETGPNILGGHSENNVAAGVHGAVIGGGGRQQSPNAVTDSYGTIGGGVGNSTGNGLGAGDGGQTVGGGYSNAAVAFSATVGGGNTNTAIGEFATVGGGFINAASGDRATVGGGCSNAAAGAFATVSGGYGNSAGNDYTFAAGRQAKANNPGVFAWADSTAADFHVSVNNRFAARASGGVYFHTNSTASTGAYLAANSGTWTDLSDHNAKQHVADVDSRDVLRKVSAMPITSWRYKGEDMSISHVGPMAQDFHAAFGLGDSDKGITTVDSGGIALAAIQGLNEVVKEKDAQINVLQRQVAEQEKRLAALEAQMKKGAR
jgi:trimeric autotransporter adhesin